jgi:hypothetical protein
LLDIVARVDDYGIEGVFAADDVAVLEEGGSSADLENHRELSSSSFSHYGVR